VYNGDRQAPPDLLNFLPKGTDLDPDVSTKTGKLPLLEMALPFPVMVPLPEMGNPISSTALTVHFLHFLALAHVQSRLYVQ
jgi:hypothetical protein